MNRVPYRATLDPNLRRSGTGQTPNVNGDGTVDATWQHFSGPERFEDGRPSKQWMRWTQQYDMLALDEASTEESAVAPRRIRVTEGIPGVSGSPRHARRIPVTETPHLATIIKFPTAGQRLGRSA